MFIINNRSKYINSDMNILPLRAYILKFIEKLQMPIFWYAVAMELKNCKFEGVKWFIQFTFNKHNMSVTLLLMSKYSKLYI